MELTISVLCIKDDPKFFVDAKGILVQNSSEPNLTVMGVSLPRRSYLPRSVARGPSCRSGSLQPAPPCIRHPPVPPPPPSSATHCLRNSEQLAKLQPPFTACAAPMWALPSLVLRAVICRPANKDSSREGMLCTLKSAVQRNDLSSPGVWRLISNTITPAGKEQLPSPCETPAMCLIRVYILNRRLLRLILYI